MPRTPWYLTLLVPLVCGCATPSPQLVWPAETSAPAPRVTQSARRVPVWQPGVHLSTALSEVVFEATSLSATTSLGLDISQSSLLAAYLEAGDTIDLPRAFAPGRHYALVVAGADATADVDVVVETLDGRYRVASDRTRGTTATVDFIAPLDALSIRITLADAEPPGDFVALAVLTDDGEAVGTHELQTAIDLAIDRAASASEVVGLELRSPGLVLHPAPTWSFAAAMLPPGDTVLRGNVMLAEAPTVVMASGSGDELELELTEQSSGLVWQDRGRAPGVLLDPHPDDRYALTLRRSDDVEHPSLVTWLLLRAE